MKIIFMGTPEFAVDSLDALIDAGYKVPLVVTQPDKPKGRGQKIAPPPVKEFAEERNIPVYQPVSLKDDDVFNYLKSFEADVFVVVAYGKILPERILSLPPKGCINVHASLLPKYRGAAPIQWSIIQGECITGITTMYMDKGLDTGDMILKKRIDITLLDNAETLHDKLKVIGAEVLIDTMKLIEKNVVKREKQDDSLSCYAPMISRQTAQIDFNKPANHIFNLVRGMNPYPYAQTKYRGKLLKITACTVKPDSFTGENGQIISVSSDGIVVKCGEGAINITEIQLEGKKKMPVSEYVKGNSFTLNELLSS